MTQLNAMNGRNFLLVCALVRGVSGWCGDVSVAESYARPVRPGGVGGQEFWNGKSEAFEGQTLMVGFGWWGCAEIMV